MFTVEKASWWASQWQIFFGGGGEEEKSLKFLPLQGTLLYRLVSHMHFWKARLKSFHLQIELDLFL